MNRSKIIIIASILVLLCMTGTAYADTPPMPDLPSTIEIQKNNDVSASFLSNLLGPTWKFIAGDAAADDLGGMGRYHGLLIGFLGMFNVAAMMFVSAAILYTWGILAVNSAHKGQKIGEGGSFWIPVRHAFSFSLTVPVLNGLSLMQVAMLACISFSINIANTGWDWAGNYIVNNSQAGIVDNSSPLIEDESLMLIQPMFQAVLISEYLRALNEGFDGDNDHINPTIKAHALPQTVDPYNLREYKSTELVGDRYVVVREPLDGAITLYVMPGKGMPLGQLGAVTINATQRHYDRKTRQLVPMAEDGIALENIANARLSAVIKAADELRVAARFYMQQRKIWNSGQPIEYKNGLEIAREYRQTVNSATEQWVSAIKEANNTKGLLEKSLDSKNGESQLGWPSAGLFSTALAQSQRKIDALIYGSTSRFEYPDSDLPDQGITGDIARFFGSKNTVRVIGSDAIAAFNAAPRWAVDNLLGGRIYADRDEEGDGPGLINRTLGAIFLDGTGENGLVATTLSKLRAYDPIVVLSDFGGKCWELAGWLALGSGLAGLAGIGTGVLTSGMILAFSVGVTLQIIAPLTVVSIWLYAVLHWLVRVVEALIAAPFWASAHLMPEGSGFAGNAARKGYVLFLDILTRPILLVAGACVSVAMWIGAAQLFSMIFSSYLNSYTAYAGAGLIKETVIMGVILIIFFILYTKVWILMVSTMPDRIMNWVGSVGGSLGGEESSGMAPLATAGTATAKGASMIGNAATGAASGGHALYSKIRGKDKDKDKGGKGDSPANMVEKAE